MPTSDETPRDINRAHWDGLAAVHGRGMTGGYYDIEALVAGADPIQDEVDRTLSIAAPDGIAGLSVLHVQSHIGMDSVALARRGGGDVTCVDFSGAALAEARSIAERAGVELELVEADSTRLPASLHGRFDLAYATIGVTCWIEDIDAWMRSVAACLRPGGVLVLVEMHPLVMMTDSLDPLVLDVTYGFNGPVHYDEDGSYAAPDASLPETRGGLRALARRNRHGCGRRRPPRDLPARGHGGNFRRFRRCAVEGGRRPIPLAARGWRTVPDLLCARRTQGLNPPICAKP